MNKKYYPLSEFSGVEDIVDRTIDRVFSDFFPLKRRHLATTKAWIPACDLIDKGDYLLVKAEVPGLKNEDLNISVDENSITLEGEVKHCIEEKSETYYRSERRYGSFSRAINLPVEINPNKVNATLKDGVLEVKLPKKQARKAKKIEIKINKVIK